MSKLENHQGFSPESSYHYFFSRENSDHYFQRLREETPWKQETIKLYGKKVDIPRLTAWFGDPGTTYRYSGITVRPLPWTKSLLQIKREIESVSGAMFNSALLNLYRDGRDGVSWHSDDEPELGQDPVIGSVSFGETRKFQLCRKRKPEIKNELFLSHGSYLIMKGPTQHNWQHQVPKQTLLKKPRINLTFRLVS